MTFNPADIAAALAELKRDGTTVDLVEGETYKLPSGLQQVGEGSTLDGHGAHLIAPSPMRIVSRAPGVTLRNFSANGYITLYNYASRYLVEDVEIDHSLDGVTHLNHGAKAAATGMFMTWLPLSRTKMLEKLTYRRCTGRRSYHHGFNLNLEGAQEGGEFRDVLFEDCKALSPGSGFEPQDRSKGPAGSRDWSCGFDIPDAGDITRLTVRDCLVDDAWQDGFHLDGSWTGHRQNQVDVLFERCTATRCGRRTSPASVEKFRSGFYVQTGRLVDCRTEACANAGFGIINERANSLEVVNCSDEGSAYGMILNYAAPGARIQFTSKAAKVRAFVGQAGSGGGSLDLTVHDAPTPKAITLGRALRIDYLGCDNHAAQQRDKYDRLGYTLQGDAITVRFTGLPPMAETWPSSRVVGGPKYVLLPAEPATPPAVVTEPDVPLTGIPAPAPVPAGRFKVIDGCVWYSVDGTIWRQLPTPFLPRDATDAFAAGRVYGPEA
jgi:hypothetical protein